MFCDGNFRNDGICFHGYVGHGSGRDETVVGVSNGVGVGNGNKAVYADQRISGLPVVLFGKAAWKELEAAFRHAYSNLRQLEPAFDRRRRQSRVIPCVDNTFCTRRLCDCLSGFDCRGTLCPQNGGKGWKRRPFQYSTTNSRHLRVVLSSESEWCDTDQMWPYLSGWHGNR